MKRANQLISECIELLQKEYKNEWLSGKGDH